MGRASSAQQSTAVSGGGITKPAGSGQATQTLSEGYAGALGPIPRTQRPHTRTWAKAIVGATGPTTFVKALPMRCPFLKKRT
ncbi:MAG: hypothetical protein WDW36_001674 [Sanguina aurantia]